jgi:hypothetical protein
VEKKRKRKPIRTREERERWKYNNRRFEQVLADALRRDGASPEEIKRRLGYLPEPS